MKKDENLEKLRKKKDAGIVEKVKIESEGEVEQKIIDAHVRKVKILV